MFSFRLIRRLGYTAAFIGFALCALHLTATEAHDTISSLNSGDGAGLVSVLPSSDTTSPGTPAPTTAEPDATIADGTGDVREVLPGGAPNPLDGVRDAIGENIADPFWAVGDALSGD